MAEKENINKFLENGALSENVKADLVEAWNKKVEEAREEIAAELRSEFAKKYDYDKQQLVEAADNMIRKNIVEVVKQLNTTKKKYSDATQKIEEGLKSFHNFAIKKLATEVDELRADRKALEESLQVFGKFIMKQTSTEMSKFVSARKSLEETKQNLIKENKVKLVETKKDFVTRAASEASQFINNVLRREISEFRGQLNEARKNIFGQKIFEAFNEEFGYNFFKKNTEFGKLLKGMKEREKLIGESLKVIREKDALIVEARQDASKAKDILIRERKISSSIAHLPKDQQKVMKDLLVSVPTVKLEESIKKYLPVVEKGEKATMTAKRLVEGSNVRRVVTGDRQVDVNLVESSKDVIDNDMEYMFKMAEYKN